MTAALLLVVVQLGAVLALAVGMVVEAMRGAAQAPGPAVVMAVMFVLLVALLAAAVRALWQGRRWGRGPVLTWQLLLLAIGVSQASTLVSWLVVLLIVMPIAVTVGLVVPAAVAWTTPASSPKK